MESNKSKQSIHPQNSGGNKNTFKKTNVSGGQESKKRKINPKDIFAAIVAIILVSIAGSMLYISNVQHKDELSNMDREKEELQQQLQKREEIIDEMVSTFNDIETDLNTIAEKEKIVAVTSDNVEITKSKKDQVIDNIRLIGNLLESNKKKIAQLNKKLKNSGMQIASLEKKINEFEKTILARDSSVQVLREILTKKDFQIADLNDRIESMETTINDQNSIIDYQISEINKAYLTQGNFKELEAKGVLEKNGGFLWFGQKSLKPNVKEDAFQEINILETKTIPVHSKKVALITNHPKESYSFIIDSTETIAYLEIKDPMKFWKISKYAVLETKK